MRCSSLAIASEKVNQAHRLGYKRKGELQLVNQTRSPSRAMRNNLGMHRSADSTVGIKQERNRETAAKNTEACSNPSICFLHGGTGHLIRST